MNDKSGCCICGTNLEDVLNLGELKTSMNLKVHYYCLLLSSTITQRGQDNEGILGFLHKDILQELKRIRLRYCHYCKKQGAAIYCSTKGCKITFHLPCGISHGSGHQFFGSFLSTCHTHKMKQKFLVPTVTVSCPICYEAINFHKNSNILWAPCCKKNSYFHKECIQKMAVSAGYFFKCPICNEKEKFQKTMKQFGVFIPDRDAAWELEPNAYQELYERHRECNAELCLCPKTRNYVLNNGLWHLIICNTCGSQGIHVGCLQQKNKFNWTCDDCIINPAKIDKNNDTRASTSSNGIGSSCSKSVSSTISKKPKRTTIESDNYYARIVHDENQSGIINIIDSDDDIEVVEDIKYNSEQCLQIQDVKILPVRLIKEEELKHPTQSPDDHLNNLVLYDNNELGFKITDVRSITEDEVYELQEENSNCHRNNESIKNRETDMYDVHTIIESKNNETNDIDQEIHCQEDNSKNIRKSFFSLDNVSYKLLNGIPSIPPLSTYEYLLNVADSDKQEY